MRRLSISSNLAALSYKRINIVLSRIPILVLGGASKRSVMACSSRMGFSFLGFRQDFTRPTEIATDCKAFGELREEMKRCLSSIDQEQANILRMQFFKGKTQGEIAERIGKSCQRVHQIKSKGLRELRKPQYSRQLLPYAEYLDLLAWRSTGFQSFKSSGLSSVERAVERLERQASPQNKSSRL